MANVRHCFWAADDTSTYEIATRLAAVAGPTVIFVEHPAAALEFAERVGKSVSIATLTDGASPDARRHVLGQLASGQLAALVVTHSAGFGLRKRIAGSVLQVAPPETSHKYEVHARLARNDGIVVTLVQPQSRHRASELISDVAPSLNVTLPDNEVLERRSASALAKELGLSDNLVTALAADRLAVGPTQVAIMRSVADRKDIVVVGKADWSCLMPIGLPLLVGHELVNRQAHVLAIVSRPEMAHHYGSWLGSFAKAAGVQIVTPGDPPGRQAAAQVKRGADVLIATPDTLETLVNDGLLTLGAVSTLIVCDPGPDNVGDIRARLDAIVRLLPAHRQVILLSAELRSSTAELVYSHQDSPAIHQLHELLADHSAGIDALAR